MEAKSYNTTKFDTSKKNERKSFMINLYRNIDSRPNKKLLKEN